MIIAQVIQNSLVKCVRSIIVNLVPSSCGGEQSREDIHTAVCGRPNITACGHALKQAAAHGEPMLEQTPGGT